MPGTVLNILYVNPHVILIITLEELKPKKIWEQSIGVEDRKSLLALRIMTDLVILSMGSMNLDIVEFYRL